MTTVHHFNHQRQQHHSGRSLPLSSVALAYADSVSVASYRFLPSASGLLGEASGATESSGRR